jgi:membrane protease subunit HflK
MLTGDLNILEIEWIIQYRISDPRAWLFNVNIPDRIATIRDVSRSVINQLVGDRAIIGIMGSERSAMGVEALNMMNEIFRNYGMGISVHEVVFQNSVPPDRVRPAFEDVNMASQEMRRLISEGMRTYNEVIPRSRGEAQRVVQVARGYAAERVNMARGDVARFNAVLTEYQASPAVTRQRLYYETMEEIFKNSTGKNIIDHRLDNFLPMQNLGR